MRNRIAVGIVLAVVAAVLPAQLAQASDQAAGHRHHDETLRTSDDGFDYYVDPAPVATERPAPGNARAQAATALYPVSQTFKLHSLAGSSRKIYLDFNGYVLSSSSPWVTGGTMSARTVTRFSLDGNAAFSAAEHTQMQEIWRIVAEKFAPFNVDVTTEEPGASALSRSSSGDTTFGVRAVVTSDTAAQSDACGSCAGIAWDGTFDFPGIPQQQDPAWVFAPSSISTSTASTVAHEVGHTLGLGHDGGPVNPNYYAGHNNWIPIMGLAFNGRAIAQWSKGEYAGATNTQDDLAEIAAGGTPRRADDAGDTTGSATALPTDSTYRRNGIIGTASDKDVYRISRSCTAPLAATANAIGKGASLDISLEILDSTGAVLGTDNPASGQTFVTDTMVPTGINANRSVGTRPPGTYYVRLDGVGSGNPLTTGYSDYASIGQYALAISGCPAKKPSAAKIGTATSGAKRGVKNATARWGAPASTGGAPITGYRVIAYQLNSRGKIVKTRYSGLRSPATRKYTWTLPGGRYRFKVVAYNRVGAGPASGFSRIVLSR